MLYLFISVAPPIWRFPDFVEIDRAYHRLKYSRTENGSFFCEELFCSREDSFFVNASFAKSLVVPAI